MLGHEQQQTPHDNTDLHQVPHLYQWRWHRIKILIFRIGVGVLKFIYKVIALIFIETRQFSPLDTYQHLEADSNLLHMQTYS